jgi:hypothetical protein
VTIVLHVGVNVMSASFIGAPLVSSKSAGALYNQSITSTTVTDEDENEDDEEEEEQRTGLKDRLVRKLKSSFRFRKQAKISAAATKPESGSRSVPHSPQVEKRSTVAVVPAQTSRRSTPTPKSRCELLSLALIVST